MIDRIPGSIPTRSRAVIHGGIAYTVAVAPEKKPSTYEQTRQALELIDRSLSDAETDKTRILTAFVYLARMSDKAEMNRAWDEWVFPEHAPMRACLGVALEGEDLVEIVVTAALSDHRR